MERFLERHSERVVGVLSGFDRLLFRGSVKSLSYPRGVEIFLSSHGVLIKNFAPYVKTLSDRLKRHAIQFARQQGRPYHYIHSPKLSKEEFAKQIAQRDGITEGLICVLACVEPCWTYDVQTNASGHIEIVGRERQCVHLYFYMYDRQFGLMHVRLQTWLPMTIQVCVNGREYLARELDREGIRYEQRDNCFAWIENLPRAQEILDRLTHRKWEKFLNAFAKRFNPWIKPKEGLNLHGYYWTVRQGEFATDVMFRDERSLKELYPALVKHAIHEFSCRDTLRFMERRTNRRFNGEVKTSLQEREDGIRVKHWLEENSIKMYDKQGVVLRIETTINRPQRFRVRRKVTRKGQVTTEWVQLRKGIADMKARVELSRNANERYLEALAEVQVPSPTHKILDPVQRRKVKRGRSYRALRPMSKEESLLFQILLRGEFTLTGFRNVDVRRALYATDEHDPVRRRRASGRTTRWFLLLRAHGLISKIPHNHCYHVTTKGHRLMTTALKLRRINLAQLAA